MSLPRTLLVLSLLPACVDKGDSGGETSAAPLLWYSTCGDPVCNTYSGPFQGVPLCTTEAEGATCTPEGATCDPVNDCNALLTCSTEDPKMQEGGCPISLRRYKEQIRYLSPEQRAAMADALMGVKLANYQYKGAEGATAERLGFLIDDLPVGSPAVLPDGGHVDVYGFTSMTVAAVQGQQAEIDALKAELAALRAEVAAMRATTVASP